MAKACKNEHGVIVDEHLSLVSVFGRDGVIIDALHLDMRITEQLVGWTRDAFGDAGIGKTAFNACRRLARCSCACLTHTTDADTLARARA